MTQMRRHYRWFIAILLLSAFCIWVVLPDTTGVMLDFDNDGTPEFNLRVQQSLGLDLVGGLRVLLQAELPPDSFTRDDLLETANNVGRRVNALGLTEATVQLQGTSRILVELPGVTDPEQAIGTIQQTALLEFVNFGMLNRSQVDALIGQRILTTEQDRINQARAELTGEPVESTHIVNPITGLPFETIMTGAGLQAAAAAFDPTANRWDVQFELTASGSETFSRYTTMARGTALAIVLDAEVLSAPVINDTISNSGVIQGDFTVDEARTLAVQLRSGALPIPLRVESATTVGATLGQESIAQSVRAGVIGVFVVLTFMVLYYRVPGIAAALALVVFILLNFAIFKLVPVTLTLPAVTGFLISIGTAVDGNILIFERMKEELRAGKSLGDALDAGFDRAWTSIRDSNISTIIICAVLFFFGQTPGASLVSGFALTLIIGLVLNLFTAVLVTRTFLYIFYHWFQRPLSQRRWLVGA
ncbi:MAG TPA: protein translocase subunit SecD [Aggregatilineales bacterium]|nr:protein translocase subunit SecD [Aggregatilineales bacterium]